MHTYICIHMYLCVCVCAHVQIQVHVNVYAFVYAFVYTYGFIMSDSYHPGASHRQASDRLSIHPWLRRPKGGGASHRRAIGVRFLFDLNTYWDDEIDGMGE